MKTFREYCEETNKEFYDRVTKGNVVPAIDPEEYPPRPGLEGPFRIKGKILYYDPKEGKYYDSKSDWYVEP